MCVDCHWISSEAQNW